MSREAFEAAMAALPPEQRHGLGAQLAWPIWQAARAAALEEAAQIADAHATCEGIAQRIAADIRALKDGE